MEKYSIEDSWVCVTWGTQSTVYNPTGLFLLQLVYLVYAIPKLVKGSIAGMISQVARFSDILNISKNRLRILYPPYFDRMEAGDHTLCKLSDFSTLLK